MIAQHRRRSTPSEMVPRGRNADKGAMLALLLFISLLALATSQYSALLPSHYDFQEKFSCVKNLDLFLDRGVLHSYSTEFLGSWPGNTNFDCKTSVFTKTRNTGIIAVIQALKFRKVAETCKDYVKFSEDTTQLCSEIAFGLKRSKSGKLPPPPTFISSFSGLFTMDPNLYFETVDSKRMDSRKRFVSPGSWVTASYYIATDVHIHSQPALEYEEDLQFTIAYTGFQNCEDTNFTGQMFNCGYGVCILNVFVNDGVVNCPFGDCRDEGGCENAVLTSPLITGEVNVTEASTEGLMLGRGGVTAVKLPTAGAGVPMAYALRQYPVTALDNGLRDIGDELKKHNDILGRIATLMEKGVEGGKGEEAGKKG